MDKPVIICLTPVRNEAWILERFLKAASLWADHIIIADQNSTDGSQAIARKFPKVILIENNSGPYHEFNRVELLVGKAREIPGKKLLIALDADEFFTSNILYSPEWQHAIQSPPGTCLRVQWIHPLPGLLTAARDERIQYYVGYMDDGAEIRQTRALHNARLPMPGISHQLFFNDISILHYNLVDTGRDKSKKRWYMCWELLNNKTPPFHINRGYLHHHVLEEPEPFRKEWIEEYAQHGIDMTSVSKFAEYINFEDYGKTDWNFEPVYWWDEEILQWMRDYGPGKFSGLDIWDKDWDSLGKKKYGDEVNFKRPASLMDRIIIRYIRNTPGYRNRPLIKRIDKFLAPLLGSGLK